jgi:hypothetical protein
MAERRLSDPGEISQMSLTRTDEDKLVAILGIVRELLTMHCYRSFKAEGSVEDKLEHISGFWINDIHLGLL